MIYILSNVISRQWINDDISLPVNLSRGGFSLPNADGFSRLFHVFEKRGDFMSLKMSCMVCLHRDLFTSLCQMFQVDDELGLRAVDFTCTCIPSRTLIHARLLSSSILCRVQFHDGITRTL